MAVIRQSFRKGILFSTKDLARVSLYQLKANLQIPLHLLNLKREAGRSFCFDSQNSEKHNHFFFSPAWLKFICLKEYPVVDIECLYPRLTSLVSDFLSSSPFLL